MSSRRRDRHERGLRGPLASPNPYTAWVAQTPRRIGRTEFFSGAVSQSISSIARTCPQALDGIRLGVEDVPFLHTDWKADEVPLAAAVERSEDSPAQVVIYRRPLEHRATNRQGLRELVHRTIVEQLAALTGFTVEAIDPDAVDDY